MPEPVLRVLAYSWNGLPIASLAIFALGGLVFIVMNRTPSPSSARTRALQVPRAGWIARWRAARGIAHRPGQVGVAYASAMRPIRLDMVALNHGGYIGG